MSYDSILYRAPSGFAGDLTRATAPFTAEPNISSEAIDFGSPVVYDTGKVRAVVTTDTAISGIAIRPFPIQSSSNAFGTGTYAAGDVVDVLKDGYIAVKVQTTTVPVRGGAVYVRVVAATGLVIGGFEAADDAANTFLVAGATFNGGVDANGVSEIFLSIA